MRVVERVKCHAAPAKQSPGIREEAFGLCTVATHTLDFDSLREQGECLAPVFQALAADTYALDLVIKATWQSDGLLIQLSTVPPHILKQNKCLSQL